MRRALARLTAGLAFLEVFPREDDTIGDDVGYVARPASTYRRLFEAAGLTHVGLHGWAGRALARDLTTFERGVPRARRPRGRRG